MQRAKHKLWLIIFVMGLSVMLIGCKETSGVTSSENANKTIDQEPAAESTNSREPTAPEKTMEPIEVVMIGGDAEEVINELYVVPFNKKYSDIRLKYLFGNATNGQALPQLIATGQKFDVYYAASGGFENLINTYDLGYDLTDILQAHRFDISHLEPSAIEALQRDSGGKLYGLPSNLLSYLIYYNKAIFNQFGVDYPTDGMTWSETFELAKRITRSEGGVHYYGIGHASTTAMMDRNQFGLPVADIVINKPIINTEAKWSILLQTLFVNPEIMKAVEELGRVPNWASFSKDQNLAMITYSSTVPTALEADIKPLDWDMVSVPIFPEMPGTGTQATPVYFGVASLSDQKEAAAQVVQYFSSIEFSVLNSKTGVLMASTAPEVVEVLGSETAFPDKNWGAIKYYPFAPLAPKAGYSSKVLSIYGAQLNQVIAGEVDLNTALRTMEELAQQEIEAHLAK